MTDDKQILELLTSLQFELNLDQLTYNDTIRISNQLKQYEFQIDDSSSRVEQQQIQIRCAIFIAAQQRFDNQLQKYVKKSIGISLEQIIQTLDSQNNFDEQKKSNLVEKFLVQLKWFMERIDLEKEIKNEIQSVIYMYGFMKSIFNKFNSFYSAIVSEYQDKEANESRDKQRDLLWLIYIAVKSQMVKQKSNPDVIQYLNILCSLIYTIFSSKFQEPSYQTAIKQFCLDYLGIQDSQYFLDIQRQVQLQVEQLCSQRILYNYPYLSQNNVVYQNIQKINQHYTQSIKPDLIMDERTFLNLKQNYAPHQFTPLVMHKMVQQKSVQNLDQIRFIKNKEDIGQANFMTPNVRKRSGSISIHAGNQETPLKRAILMYNWQFKKAQKVMHTDQKSFNSTVVDETLIKTGNEQFKQQIVDKIELVLERVQQKGPKIIGQQKYLIICFFFVTLEELISNELSQDPISLLENEIYILSTLAICLHVHFFIKNESQLNTETILQICQIEAVEFWRNLNNYNLGVNKQMPELIKSNLNETERIVLFKLVWKQESVLMKVIQQNQNVQSHHQFLFQRLMYHVAIELNNLIDHLKFDNKIGEATWNIIKHIVYNKPEFLKQKHFAVIIICTLNIVSKYFNQSKGLFNISQVYQKLRNVNESEDIESKIQCEDQTKDLLYFYNKVYYEEIKYSMEKIDKSNGCLEILQKQLPNFNQIHLLDDDCLRSPLRDYKMKHQQIYIDFEESQKQKEKMKQEMNSKIKDYINMSNPDYVDQIQKRQKTDFLPTPIIKRGTNKIFNKESEDNLLCVQKQKSIFESPSQHYVNETADVQGQGFSSLKKKNSVVTPDFKQSERFMLSSEKILNKFSYHSMKVPVSDEKKDDTSLINLDLFKDSNYGK